MGKSVAFKAVVVLKGSGKGLFHKDIRTVGITKINGMGKGEV